MISGRLASLILTALLLIVGVITVAGLIFAPDLVGVWASGYAAVPGKAEPGRDAAVGRLTAERLDAGRTWLAQQADDRWFVQVFAAEAANHAEIEALLRRLAAGKTDMTQVHVYYSELSGRPRYGVIYGGYASNAEATAAIRGLPAVMRANKPYPRQVTRLR